MVFGVAVVGGQGGGVEMFGLRGFMVGVAAVFCGGRKCKKKTYRRTFARLQVLFDPLQSLRDSFPEREALNFVCVRSEPNG